MGKKQYWNSEAKNERWIKEGRGQGSGPDYKPWLTIRDVPSQGRSHRIFGHLTQRPHHLLSDLELATFFFLQWPHLISLVLNFVRRRESMALTHPSIPLATAKEPVIVPSRKLSQKHWPCISLNSMAPKPRLMPLNSMTIAKSVTGQKTSSAMK